MKIKLQKIITTATIYVFRYNDLYAYVIKYSVFINILACTDVLCISKFCLLLFERYFDFFRPAHQIR